MDISHLEQAGPRWGRQEKNNIHFGPLGFAAAAAYQAIFYLTENMDSVTLRWKSVRSFFFFKDIEGYWEKRFLLNRDNWQGFLVLQLIQEFTKTIK
jgi:hypothetical protein